VAVQVLVSKQCKSIVSRWFLMLSIGRLCVNVTTGDVTGSTEEPWGCYHIFQIFTGMRQLWIMDEWEGLILDTDQFLALMSVSLSIWDGHALW